MGKTAEAEATFRRALSMRPSFWGSDNDLGGFQFRIGRYAEAESNFQRALDPTPDNSRADNNLGSTCYIQQRYVVVMQGAAAGTHPELHPGHGDTVQW